MADIVLMDKNGEAVTYEGVTKVALSTADGESYTFEEPFSLGDTYWYLATLVEGTTYKIVSTTIFSGGSMGSYAMVTAQQCTNVGYAVGEGETLDYRLVVICSKVSLTVGQEYTLSQITGG